jgi:hypothetical protein
MWKSNKNMSMRPWRNFHFVGNIETPAFDWIYDIFFDEFVKITFVNVRVIFEFDALEEVPCVNGFLCGAAGDVVLAL